MRTCSAVLLSISLVRAASATDAQSRITHEGYEKDLKNFGMYSTAIFSGRSRKCGPRRVEGEPAPILECDLNPTRSIVA